MWGGGVGLGCYSSPDTGLRKLYFLGGRKGVSLFGILVAGKGKCKDGQVELGPPRFCALEH